MSRLLSCTPPPPYLHSNRHVCVYVCVFLLLTVCFLSFVFTLLASVFVLLGGSSRSLGGSSCSGVRLARGFVSLGGSSRSGVRLARGFVSLRGSTRSGVRLARLGVRFARVVVFFRGSSCFGSLSSLEGSSRFGGSPCFSSFACFGVRIDCVCLYCVILLLLCSSPLGYCVILCSVVYPSSSHCMPHLSSCSLYSHLFCASPLCVLCVCSRSCPCVSHFLPVLLTRTRAGTSAMVVSNVIGLWGVRSTVELPLFDRFDSVPDFVGHVFVGLDGALALSCTDLSGMCSLASMAPFFLSCTDRPPSRRFVCVPSSFLDLSFASPNGILLSLSFYAHRNYLSFPKLWVAGVSRDHESWE